ncbi:MAG: hypothetical protein LBJ11_08265 [Oscillospiraceae bacterium]|jgi:triacylglycerol lipase|nr:hypothetical protein [Oscillospiraceae bacterium]
MFRRMTAFLLGLLQSLLISQGATTLWAHRTPAAQSRYPFVLVHGLMGYGYNDLINEVLPYWGQTTGDIPAVLAEQGYECYTASVGPLSSAWDRACELYAQLAGGTVDYGAAHASLHGHSRFGRTYETPLFPGWGPERKVNLLGHSFGAATIRLLACLLAEGDAGERAAAPDPSPLFEGGKGGWICSVTSLAGPHNGTAALSQPETAPPAGERRPGASDVLSALALRTIGNLPLGNAIYDFQLEQWGLTDPPLTLTKPTWTQRRQWLHFTAGTDNALYDLSLHGAYELNRRLFPVEEIYYFSFAAVKTNLEEATGDQIPEQDLFFLFLPNAKQLGLHGTPWVSADGITIDESWQPNDGLVPLASALYPFGEAHQDFSPGTAPDDLPAGVWLVMPVQHMDHLGFSGGFYNQNRGGLRLFYAEQFSLVEATY